MNFKDSRPEGNSIENWSRLKLKLAELITRTNQNLMLSLYAYVFKVIRVNYPVLSGYSPLPLIYWLDLWVKSKTQINRVEIYTKIDL